MREESLSTNVNLSSLDKKRAKLEEVRKLKIQRIKQLEKARLGETPTPTLDLEELRREEEEERRRLLELEKSDEIRKQASELHAKMQKYKSENLKMASGITDVICYGTRPESYEIEIQCDINKEAKMKKDEETEENEDELIHIQPSAAYRKKSILSGIPGGKKPQGVLGWGAAQGNTIPEVIRIEYKEEPERQVKLVSDDVKKNMLHSNEFQDFFSRNYRFIERALNEKDIFDTINDLIEEEKEVVQSLKTTTNWIANSCEMYDEGLCSKRTVTSLDWSIKHPELMLSGYSRSEDAGLNDPNGLVLLWSLAMRKKPEFVFSCPTEVTCAKFHKYNPKLILGATFTGQLLIWDTRGKSLPVQKTNPGAKHHSYPIYCMDVVGSTNSNNILTVSNDGVLCTWSSSSLTKANKRLELKAKKKNSGSEMISPNSNGEDIGAISMATSEAESNNILIGTDDSDIYQVSLHQTSDSHDNISDVYRHHSGPVTSINHHPGDVHKNVNLTHLFLSTSVDWTMNLWSKNDNDGPLVTFDINDDYVYDAKFHPTCPSLFSSVDGTGKLDFWDLNKDTEVPVFRHDVGKDSLNKLSWSYDGKRLVTGDIAGKVTLFNLDKHALAHKTEDAYKFEKMLQNMKQSKMTTKY